MSGDRGFAEWLLAEGVLSKADLRRALDVQRGRLGNLDTEIIDLKLLTERETLDALGRFHKTRTVAGSELEFASSAAIHMLTPRIASRLGVVPFKLEGRTLSVATLNPGDLLVEDEIAQLTGCMVASFVTLEIRFVQALHLHYQAPITARYAGLIRRLTGVRSRPDIVASHRVVDDVDPAPLPSTTEESHRKATPKHRAPSPAQAEDAVELSADELDLFPSLSFREEVEQSSAGIADASADGSVSGEVALLREEHAPPPPPQSPTPPPAPPVATEIGPDELLQAASLAMQNVEMRDDIADAMLGFCAPLFQRRMMLVMRKGTIMGWRGEGAGVDETAVRAIAVPNDEPSVFSGLLQGVDFWLGPLPKMPHNSELVLALGGEPPTGCYILPVKVRDRIVCFLYGDNQDEGVGGLPLGELKRLAAKAGLAFQIYLIKGKIRAL